MRVSLPLILLLTLSACATLSGGPRASSSVGCAHALVNSKVPAGLPDKRTHCMAAGLIARHCSVVEAYLASWGKEVNDLFTPRGDAEWADLRADRVGVRCARGSKDDNELAACCEQAQSR